MSIPLLRQLASQEQLPDVIAVAALTIGLAHTDAKPGDTCQTYSHRNQS